MRLGFDVAAVAECDLLERDERTLRAGKRAFTVNLRPNQIRTFRLTPA